jgi:hypothetical protein
MQLLPLFTDDYLFAHLEDEYQVYSESRDEAVRRGRKPGRGQY